MEKKNKIVQELTLVILLKEIASTPWYRFWKIRKLHKEALEYSKLNNLDYHKI
jgi:hypothetical protein